MYTVQLQFIFPCMYSINPSNQISPDNTHKPKIIYIGGLILGLSSLYSCFLFKNVGMMYSSVRITV